MYLSEKVTEVAKSLLGKSLIVRANGSLSSGMIVETEAYSGAVDRASHAYRNKLTDRTKIMYLQGGHAYVYLCYGIHNLFNIVTNHEGKPDAVLIRAIQPEKGINRMLHRRNTTRESITLTNGPGKLSMALGINRKHNGMDLTNDNIWLEDNGNNLEPNEIVNTTRIGVDYAGDDAYLPWRFYINGNRWVSKT